MVVGGRTQALAVIRSLGAEGVPVIVLRYHDQDMGHGSRWVREVIDCPHPERDPDGFDRVLDRVAARFPGSLLVPPSDIAVAAVSARKRRLGELGFVVAAPEWDVVSTCLDKAATWDFARRHGVDAPATVAVREAGDLERFADEVGFPGVLKPTVSHRYKAVFGRKWTRVDNLEEATRHHLEARAAGLEVVAQELVPGDELCGANYNAYVWGDDGEVVEMTAAKIRNSPSETGSPCVAVSRRIPEVAEAGRHLLRALGYRGFANVEFKRDARDGTYKLIEVNARHNLSSALAIRCGINFPWLEYRHRMLGRPPVQPDYEEGVYWIDVTRDLQASLSYLRRGDYSVGRFARPYLSGPVFAVASARDPRPALIRAGRTATQVRRKLVARIRR
ncbi:hypothetical protein GCM10023321_10450 [Pseudonocardia eucalypti]|uniref:ATP-grasp domain-containing protein n=1 Tax=Pseudonocardia eucalypti TaxID=648755 RepID=A0ABP9PPW0_9PSEU